ncbi:hypothetical protein Mpsy_0524 [Methanolobus psychrophilus R15]|nr:hypothetical protein Mpsy_0524 [Methanolobus psychrophilus R15]
MVTFEIAPAVDISKSMAPTDKSKARPTEDDLVYCFKTTSPSY